jgi:hypothetical protein
MVLRRMAIQKPLLFRIFHTEVPANFSPFLGPKALYTECVEHKPFAAQNVKLHPRSALELVKLLIVWAVIISRQKLHYAVLCGVKIQPRQCRLPWDVCPRAIFPFNMAVTSQLQKYSQMCSCESWVSHSIADEASDLVGCSAMSTGK